MPSHWSSPEQESPQVVAPSHRSDDLRLAREFEENCARLVVIVDFEVPGYGCARETDVALFAWRMGMFYLLIIAKYFV